MDTPRRVAPRRLELLGGRQPEVARPARCLLPADPPQRRRPPQPGVVRRARADLLGISGEMSALRSSLRAKRGVDLFPCSGDHCLVLDLDGVGRRNRIFELCEPSRQLLSALHQLEHLVLHLPLLAVEHLDLAAHVVGVASAQAAGVQPVLLCRKLALCEIELTRGLVESEFGLAEAVGNLVALGAELLKLLVRTFVGGEGGNRFALDGGDGRSRSPRSADRASPRGSSAAPYLRHLLQPRHGSASTSVRSTAPPTKSATAEYNFATPGRSVAA